MYALSLGFRPVYGLRYPRVSQIAMYVRSANTGR